tara:strand:- start:620 stop:865 length:246 start_codon:yes stop_codon:yes gene_type:complete
MIIKFYKSKDDLEIINEKVDNPDLNNFIESLSKIQRVKVLIEVLESSGRNDEIKDMHQYIDFKPGSLAFEYYNNQINGGNN